MTLKHSRQRDSIKAFLSTRKDHPTAEIVYKNVRQSFPNISLGTVYRNLTLLADLGEITRLRVGDGADHFDYDTSPHYHFVCSECGCIMDMELPPMELLTDAARQSFEGNIEGHVTFFYGQCNKCIQKII